MITLLTEKMPRLKFKSTSLFAFPMPVYEYDPGEMLLLCCFIALAAVVGLIAAFIGTLMAKFVSFLGEWLDVIGPTPPDTYDHE